VATAKQAGAASTGHDLEIRFHDLRHTYATLARRSGMDIKDLSVRLGHENVATTMNPYQHIPVDMARESAQSVADYILG
jgi:integrase